MTERDPNNMGQNNLVQGIAIYIFLIAGIGIGAIAAYLRGTESLLDAKLYLFSFGAGGAVVGHIILKCIARSGRCNSKSRTDASRQ